MDLSSSTESLENLFYNPILISADEIVVSRALSADRVFQGGVEKNEVESSNGFLTENLTETESREISIFQEVWSFHAKRTNLIPYPFSLVSVLSINSPG